MSRYTGYNQRGFANSSVSITRAASGSTSAINHDSTGSTSLYLPFDSDLNDDSSHNATVTAYGDAAISSAQSKFGGSSLLCDGSGDYLIVSEDGQFNFGDRDFTIELQVYVTAAGTTRLIHSGTTSTSICPFLIYITGTSFQFYASSNGSSWFISDLPLGTVTYNTWTHLAVTRQNNVFCCFQDGVLKGQTTSSNSLMDVQGGGITLGRYAGGSQYLTGYMDDVRIIDGHAQYQGLSSIGIGDTAFTAPTSAVGLRTVHPVSLYLPFDSDIQDDSNHGHTVTASGDAAISSTQAKFGSNSLALDGTGDYLTVSSGRMFRDFKSEPFTIEGWFYCTEDSTSDYQILMSTGTGTGNWRIVLRPSDKRFEFYDGAAYESTGVWTVNTWHHFAICGDGINVRQFIDGSQIRSDSNSNLTAATDHLTIGVHPGGSTYYFTGYVDDLRISKGVARYSKSFIPPSAAAGSTINGTNETNTTTGFTSLYLPFDSDVNDDSDNPFTITASGGAAISSTQAKFGGYSLGLDGSGDYLTVGSSQSAMAFAGDFTIEYWMYPTNLTDSYQGPMGCHNSSGWLFQFAEAGGRFWINGSNQITTTATTSTNQWYHVVVTRNSGTVKLFINGEEQGSLTFTSAMPTNNNLVIGATRANNQTFYGYIDDVRILNGYAKYTAPFAPPSSAVGTSVSETVNDLTTLYLPFDATVSSATVPSSQVEVYFPFEDDFGDDGPNSVTLTERGGGSSSGRDVYITSSYGVKPFGTNSAFFDNSSYTWNNTNSGNFTTTHNIDFSSNDFTIEFWAYVRPSQPNHGVLAQTYDSGGFFIQIDGDPSNGFRFGASSAGITTSALTTNTWTHFAVERYGSTVTWYVDGSANVSTSFSGTISVGGPLGLGSYQGGAGGFNGLVKDFRIINGTAVYKGNFSVPTAAHGGNGATTVSSIEGGFEDEARNITLIEKAGTSKINTSVKKFGTSSLYLDGDSDRLKYNGDLIALGNKDFTMECWFYMTEAAGTSHSTVHTLFGKMGGSSTRGFNVQVHGSNGIYMQYSTDGSSSGQSAFGFNLTPSLNTWHHVAVVRNNGTISAFLDGTAGSSTHNIGSNKIYDNGDNFEIGYKSISSGAYFPGYIDDLRIIIGKGIYTDNFTAPSSAHGHVSLEETTSTSENYSDNKFLSGIWDMTDVRDKMMQSTWVSNDTRITNGAGLQVLGHRWHIDTSTPVVWDTTTAGSNVLISNSDKTVTINGTPGNWPNNSAISTGTHSSGKVYFEATISGSPHSGYLRVGVVQNLGATTHTTIQSGSMNTWGVGAPAYTNKSENRSQKNGAEVYDGSNTHSDGDVFMWAFDIDNAVAYFGRNGSFDLSFDPVNGTGGYDMTTLGGYSTTHPWHILFQSLRNDQGSVTLRSALEAQYLPSGYSYWGTI